jgi:hypothetical protein
MASTIAAITTSGGGVVTTADSSGNLSLLSGATTVVAVTATGVAVTGTLSSSGAVTASTTLAVTGASTFTGTGKFATTIGVGNATPAASGSGITFPATQSASSDANTLDDYEEGDWTPKDGVGGSLSNNRTPTYTKTGRVIVLTFDFTWTANTDYHLTNLPFTGSPSKEPGGSCCASSATAVSSVKVTSNTTQAEMLNQIQSAAVTANRRFAGTVTYITD